MAETTVTATQGPGNLNSLPTHIETPRGRFRYGFETMEEARAAGYGLWFEHSTGYGPGRIYTAIVGNGTLAVAVREGVRHE